MSFFERIFSRGGGETVSARIAPRIDNASVVVDGYDGISSSDVKTLQLFNIETSAGVVVTEQTAMRVASVYRCVAIIAGAIASMRFNIYRRTDGLDGRERVVHDLWWVLNEQPTARFSSAVMWEFLIASMLLKGDGYALILRNLNGKATGLLPLRWDQVVPERVGDRMRYLISDLGEYWAVDQDDMLHFPGFGFGLTWNQLHGLSVIGWAARQAVGIALQADRFAGQFYGNGAHPSHVIKNPKKMTKELQEGLAEAYRQKYSGQGINGIPLILTEGLEIADISMNASDAQFLETRGFQRTDICIAFGVPPFMIGDTEKASSWGTGIESMSLGFVRYTLRPHINRVEHELNRKLFRGASPFIEVDVHDLTRADSKTRADVMRQQLGGSNGPGWKTVNEVRAMDNLPPIAGGEILYSPTKAPNAPPSPQPPPAAAVGG